MFKRNSIVTLMWLLVVPLVVSNGTLAQSKTVEVADGVYAFDNSKVSGYNSMFITTGEGVMVIEPVNHNHAKALLQAIGAVTNEPIKYLFHSHNHWDHSKGGQVFKDEGATIIAHQAAYDWMKANPHPKLLQPDEGWSGNRFSGDGTEGHLYRRSRDPEPGVIHDRSRLQYERNPALARRDRSA